MQTLSTWRDPGLLQPSNTPPHTPPPIAKALGRAVRKRRHIQDLSQQAVAKGADINLKHLSEIEQGKHDARASTILKVARALDLSYSALAAATDEELTVLEEKGLGG